MDGQREQPFPDVVWNGHPYLSLSNVSRPEIQVRRLLVSTLEIVQSEKRSAGKAAQKQHKNRKKHINKDIRTHIVSKMFITYLLFYFGLACLKHTKVFLVCLEEYSKVLW